MIKLKIKKFIDFYKEIGKELKERIDMDFLTMGFVRDGPRPDPKIKQIEEVRNRYFGAVRSDIFALPEAQKKAGSPKKVVETSQSVAENEKKRVVKMVETEYRRLESDWKKLKKEIENEEKKKRKRFARSAK